MAHSQGVRNTEIHSPERRFRFPFLPANHRAILYFMQALTRQRSVLVGGVLGFGGAWLVVACDTTGTIGPLASGVDLPAPPGSSAPPEQSKTPPECQATIEDPCMRYRIPIVGNADVKLRAIYVEKFGSACYLSVANTFDCFYEKWEKACDDAVLIGEVSGNAPYTKGYSCQPVGNGDYTLQIGPDVANRLFVTYEQAPRQTPLVMVNGMPVEVNGPYRDLVDPADIAPGNKFEGNSGIPDGDGGLLEQKAWIRQVNRKKHGGKIHSDLAGFKFPCTKGKPEICTEPDFLEDSFDPVGTYPDVHHVVPMKDKRCCPWGTNAYKNAAVISRKLNNYFTNDDPPEDEVKMLNDTQAYTP